MADGTKIGWADATWNIITGCSIVSPACTNCYAMRDAAGPRLREHPSRKGLTKIVNGKPVWTGEVRFNEQWLTQPLHWKKPRTIFVCAAGDLFHESVPDEWIDRVFAVMALAPQHQFMVLTKRAKRMLEFMSDAGRLSRVAQEMFNRGCGNLSMQARLPLPNVALGVTVEDQERADARIPDLLETPAAKRFVSIEPMLGPVDLTRIAPNECGHTNALIGYLRGGSTFPHGPELRALDLVICGGESGPDARPMHPDWARGLRDQCAAAGVPFNFKQWGEWFPRDQWEGNPRLILPDDCDCIRSNDCVHIFADAVSPATMHRVGKRRAGRLLDGVEHDGKLARTNVGG